MNAVPASGRPRLWGWLFAVSVVAIAGLRMSDGIDSTTGFILMAGAMVLLVPFLRSLSRAQRTSACSSPAGLRYARRMAAASFAYMLALGLAITLHSRTELAGIAGLAVAVLPALPIFAMIWAMARYLLDEQDEYLRHRSMIAALAGLGGVLALGSFWGFLETFGMAPHVPGWWAVPVWAVGMGLCQAWMALRDRREAGE